MRLRLAEFSLLVALLLALPLAASARETDRQQPMSVAADNTDTILTEDGDSVLSGNVAITQGTLRIGAGKATISRKAGEVVRVVLEGRPATMQQENDEGSLMKARGNRIEYDVGAETVQLSGNVEVDQAGDNLRGERIVYDLKNGRLSGSGDGSEGGRIRMTIQPRPESAEKPDAAPEKDS